jgi:hypothetical protein
MSSCDELQFSSSNEVSLFTINLKSYMLDELLSMTYVSLLLYVGCTYFYGGSSVERWRPFTSRRIPDAAKSFAARVLVGIEC